MASPRADARMSTAARSIPLSCNVSARSASIAGVRVVAASATNPSVSPLIAVANSSPLSRSASSTIRRDSPCSAARLSVSRRTVLFPVPAAPSTTTRRRPSTESADAAARSRMAAISRSRPTHLASMITGSSYSRRCGRHGGTSMSTPGHRPQRGVRNR